MKKAGFDDEIQKLQEIKSELKNAGLTDEQLMALMAVIAKQRGEMFANFATVHRMLARSSRLFMIAMILFGFYCLLESIRFFMLIFS